MYSHRRKGAYALVASDFDEAEVRRTAAHTKQRPGAAAPVRAIQPLWGHITTCLRSFEARKAIFLLALILMARRAAGLRPMRAGAGIGERETAGTDLGRVPFEVVDR